MRLSRLMPEPCIPDDFVDGWCSALVSDQLEKLKKAVSRSGTASFFCFDGRLEVLPDRLNYLFSGGVEQVYTKPEL